jgi:predicted NAD/FAD-dependent oxidoreductase
MRIVIIGAGMAGLSCAQAPVAAGHGVTLFDKGRGPGGRMSTRRVPMAEACWHSIMARNISPPARRPSAARWQAGRQAAWWPHGPPRAKAWVGTPGMNAPLAHMAAGLMWPFPAM